MPSNKKIEETHVELKDNDLQNERSFRKYSVVKQLLDILTISILLITIGWLACCKSLNSEAVAGLIGAIIGYVLSDFKKRVSN